jgi:D-psicose/D-tagatose/L-ribulose 3-epimerase
MTHFSFLLLPPLPQLGDADRIRRLFDFIRSCGYDGVELNLNLASLELMPRLQQWLAESDLALPSCCTGEAYAEGLCLSSPGPAARQGAVRRLIEYLDAVRPFGSILVVGLLQGTQRDEADPEAAKSRIVECLCEVGAAAEARGAEFVIEPVNHLQASFVNSVHEVRTMIRAIGSPAIRPMVDTVHMNIEERSLTQPIYDCGAELRHVHLCESNGGLFGTGHIAFGPILKALDDVAYGGFGSVKVYRRATMAEAAKTSIEYLRNTSL